MNRRPLGKDDYVLCVRCSSKLLTGKRCRCGSVLVDLASNIIGLKQDFEVKKISSLKGLTK